MTPTAARAATLKSLDVVTGPTRIYLRRGALRPRGGGWRRVWQSPAQEFAKEALRGGLIHASVRWGEMGFAPGGKRVEVEEVEIPVEALPMCIELVGERRADLIGALVVLVDGVQLRDFRAVER